MPLLVLFFALDFDENLENYIDWGPPVLISPAESPVILDSTRMIGEKFPVIVGVCAHLDLDI